MDVRRANLRQPVAAVILASGICALGAADPLGPGVLFVEERPLTNVVDSTGSARAAAEPDRDDSAALALSLLFLLGYAVIGRRR